MIDDMVEFIKAQLDEDEAGAHSSGPARVAWLTYRKDSGEMLYTTVAAEVGHGDVWIADGRELAPPASAMVVYDPARVLADVAAKRAVIELYETARTALEASDGTILAGTAKLNLRAYGNALRALAAAYASRPGFKPEWRLS